MRLFSHIHNEPGAGWCWPRQSCRARVLISISMGLPLSPPFDERTRDNRASAPGWWCLAAPHLARIIPQVDGINSSKSMLPKRRTELGPDVKWVYPISAQGGIGSTFGSAFLSRTNTAVSSTEVIRNKNPPVPISGGHLVENHTKNKAASFAWLKGLPSREAAKYLPKFRFRFAHRKHCQSFRKVFFWSAERRRMRIKKSRTNGTPEPVSRGIFIKTVSKPNQTLPSRQERRRRASSGNAKL